MSDVVQKAVGFCRPLRHDGIDYGDYIEQITYLLFLKMANERGIDLSRMESRTSRGKVEVIDCSWPTLEAGSGTNLAGHYIEVLRALGQSSGIPGDIYSGAQSRFNNPVNLKRLVSLILKPDGLPLRSSLRHVKSGLSKGDEPHGPMGRAAESIGPESSHARIIRPTPRWLSPPVPGSAPTRFCPSSGAAAWARSGARMISSSVATLP